MIITSIFSGLGNQLFQYAAGKALAQHHQTELKIDNSWFYSSEEKQTPRYYGLGEFNLSEKIANVSEIRHFTVPAAGGIVGRIRARYNRSLPAHRKPVYYEPHFHVDPHFFQSRRDALITGYWQSEQYFQPIASQIRTTFTLPVKGEQNRQWEQRIMAAEAVSLHVRRGDMVSNPDVARVHGACDLEYYREAARKIAEGLTEPEFFIFSDDPEWCLEHLKLDHPVHVVSNNQGDDAWQDMQLMRMCRHHIIANSSFSWWGAWLNPSESKKVIAPARWFNAANHDLRDLLPKDWMRL
jgi:hypothetical protein